VTLRTWGSNKILNAEFDEDDRLDFTIHNRRELNHTILGGKGPVVIAYSFGGRGNSHELLLPLDTAKKIIEDALFQETELPPKWELVKVSKF